MGLTYSKGAQPGASGRLVAANNGTAGLMTPKRLRRRRSHSAHHRLTLDQVSNAWAALGHAERLGLRPNLTLDINFHVARLLDPDREGPAKLRELLGLIHNWGRGVRAQTAHIYVLENKGGPNEKGVHAHVLLRIPPERQKDFDRLLKGWAKRLGLSGRGAIKPTQTGKTLRATAGKLRYMCKDLEADGLDLFASIRPNRHTGKPEIHGESKGQDGQSDGPIYGRKLGVSRNIGLTERSRYRHIGPDRKISSN